MPNHLRPVPTPVPTPAPATPEERAAAALAQLAAGHAALLAPNQLLSLTVFQLQTIVDRLEPRAHQLREPFVRVLGAAKGALAAIDAACEAPVIVPPAPGLDVKRVD